ncbi:MAG: TrmB family transcriptional regulator [Candidatus Thermoplasmatota archaeon]|nr:TrmB family transcriptional regulator [Candidatus Thermoplasmatota archaeon]
MDLKSLASVAGKDVDALLEEYAKISGTLSRLGLSEYESRAYIALVAAGSTSPTFVAEIAQIPRTSAYKTLESLEAKGYARSKSKRPRTFAAVDPSELGEALATEVRETFQKIESIKDVLSERGVPQLIYTILGKDRVLEKIGEMMDKSEHSFVISSPSIAEFRRKLGKRFTNAFLRGVEITVITGPFVKVPKKVTSIRRKGLIATDVISDGKTALLAAPDLSACGYTDNETLSSHLQDFLRIMSESEV